MKRVESTRSGGYIKNLKFNGTATLGVAICLSMLACIISTSVAQPKLTFKRATVNWPSIELFYSISCNNQPKFVPDWRHFEIQENGIEVNRFKLWCSDQNTRAPISVTLVLDGSGAMQGPGKLAAIAAGNAYIDLMDGTLDESEILGFGSSVTVRQTMTPSTELLHAAVNALPASGAPALRDGIYAGLGELIRNGHNYSQALIVVSAGEPDTVSTHSYDEIIPLAKRNNIPVYAIRLGSAYNPVDLVDLATVTGGKFYDNPGVDQISSMFQEIPKVLPECVIRYDANCMDGGLRVVDLSVVNICGGSTTGTKTYSAPLDASTFVPLHLRVGSKQKLQHSVVHLPVELLDPLDHGVFNSCVFTLIFDPKRLTFVSISTPPGSLLEGVPMTVQLNNGSVTIQTMDRKELTVATAPAMLADITFVAGAITSDTVTTITCARWDFSAGCFKPQVDAGVVEMFTERVVPPAPELVSPADRSENTPLKLDFEWGFAFDALDYELQISRDSGFSILEYSRSNIGGSPHRANTSSEGARYFWRVRARNVMGDGPWSQTWMFVTGMSPIAAISGITMVCEADVKGYSVSRNPRYSYQWIVTGGSILAGSNADTVIVRWGRPPAGSVRVLITDVQSGLAQADTVPVVITKPVPPVVTASGPLNLCDGESITLDAGPGFRSYAWSTGDTTRTIDVVLPNSYFVTAVSFFGCPALSNTVVITRNTTPVPKFSGPLEVCRGDVAAYASGFTRGHGYRWDATNGTILSGQNDTIVIVHWGLTGPASIRLTETQGRCAGSDVESVLLTSSIKPAVTIAGSTKLCEGDVVSLDAGAGYTVYQWSTGETTKKITVGRTGTYWVRVETAAGCAGNSDSVFVTVFPRPPVPVIVRTDSILSTAPGPYRYEWYRNGQILAGETGNQLRLRFLGAYTVLLVDTNGCSNLSDPFDVGTLAADVLREKTMEMQVYPTPVQDYVVVRLDGMARRSGELTLVDVYGRVLQTMPVHPAAGGDEHIIDVSRIGKGVYLLQYADERIVLRKKIIRQ